MRGSFFNKQPRLFRPVALPLRKVLPIFGKVLPALRPVVPIFRKVVAIFSQSRAVAAHSRADSGQSDPAFSPDPANFRQSLSDYGHSTEEADQNRGNPSFSKKNEKTLAPGLGIPYAGSPSAVSQPFEIMPEPTPPTPPTPPVPPTPPGPPPGDFNQAQLETVRKTEGLARAAQKPAYTALLLAEGMDAATPAALLAQCAAWRGFSGQAVTATADTTQAAGLGTDAATALRREVEYYRGKARLAIVKHPAWKDAEIAAFKARYFINTDIFANRALAEQSAADLFAHAAEDTLPGVTPARLTASAAILAAYQAPEGTQSDAQSAATQLRAQRDTAFADLLRLRHEIQLAAEGAWPWHGDDNMGVRREFLLPAGRAFTG